MRTRAPHRWHLTPRQAAALQERLRDRVVRTGNVAAPRSVAGIDVGFEREGRIARAAVVVLSFPALTPIDCAIARAPTRFPYVPGLLSFREIPVVLAALRRLAVVPDVLVCDAHGTAHPRRFGLACHLGLICDVPTVGIAKSLLIGRWEGLPDARGSHVPLVDREEVVGAVVRTRAGVAPVYVSVGHRIGLDAAVALALAITPRYRLPETTRWAHRLASSPPQNARRLADSIRGSADR